MRFPLLFALALLLSLKSIAFEEPVLKKLLKVEAALRTYGESHIGQEQDSAIMGDKITAGKVTDEAEQSKNLDKLPGDIEKVTGDLAKEQANLKKFDQTLDVPDLKAPQDAYVRALSYYKKYFEWKDMEDDERQNKLAYVQDQLKAVKKDSVQENELALWLDVLAIQQYDESRAESKDKIDGYGIENEEISRSKEELAAFKDLFEADLNFMDMRSKDSKSKDFAWDYDKNFVANYKSWLTLAAQHVALTKIEGLLTKRFTAKASELSMKGLDLDALELRVNSDDQLSIDELREMRQDLRAIGDFLKSVDNLQKKIGKNKDVAKRRETAANAVEALKGQKASLEEQLHTSEIKRNLYAYQSLTEAMRVVTDKIYNLVLGNNKYDAEKVVAWRAAFLTLMTRLETLELELATKYRGRDPYSEEAPKTSVKGIVKYFAGALDKVFIGNKTRVSKKNLMRAYQYALNGETGVASAFASTLSGLKDSVWNKDPAKIKDYFQLSNITKTIASIDEFGMQNPILTADLQRNLTHAYKLLTQNPKTGVIGDAMASAAMVYDIKEVENMARDWYLGSTTYLYSSVALSKPIPRNVLVLVDLAEMAPYLAGAYIGASGGGTVGGWMETLASWIPVVGSYKPIKTIARAAGGVAQVQLQKIAAQAVSRDHEILANSLRRAFSAYGQGKTVDAIAKDVLAYQTMRKVIQIIGNARAMGTANLLQDACTCLKKNPGALVVGGVTGCAIGGAVGFATMTASAIALPIVLPIVGASACAIGSVYLVDKIKDLAVTGRKETRELQAISEQLKKLELPTIETPESKWIQEQLPKILDKEIDMIALGVRAAKENLTSEEDKKKLVLSEVQKNLEAKELAHIRKVKGSSAIDDPSLVLLKGKLAQISKSSNLGEKEVSAVITEALKIVDKEHLDEFQVKILAQLRDLQVAVNKKDKVGAGKIVEQLNQDVDLLPVRQFESAAVEAYEHTLPQEQPQK